MRWERLFDDLAGQLDQAEQDELDAEVADRTRREVAQLALIDRLRGAAGHEVELKVTGADTIRGVVRRVGPDWLLLQPPGPSGVIVLSDAVCWLRGLPVMVRDPRAVGPVESRMDLAHALRAVARDRATVRLAMRDGGQLVGTIDRVGRDFVDLAEHPAGEPRRPGQVHTVSTVAFAAFAVVVALG